MGLFGAPNMKKVQLVVQVLEEDIRPEDIISLYEEWVMVETINEAYQDGFKVLLINRDSDNFTFRLDTPGRKATIKRTYEVPNDKWEEVLPENIRIKDVVSKDDGLSRHTVYGIGFEPYNEIWTLWDNNGPYMDAESYETVMRLIR